MTRCKAPRAADDIAPLIAWAEERADLFEARDAEAEAICATLDPATRRAMTRDGVVLRSIAHALEHYARLRVPPAPLASNPALEYEANTNFLTALSVVVAAHTGLESFALLTFEKTKTGNVVRTLGTIPRDVLHEALKDLVARQVIAKKRR